MAVKKRTVDVETPKAPPSKSDPLGTDAEKANWRANGQRKTDVSPKGLQAGSGCCFYPDSCRGTLRVYSTTRAKGAPDRRGRVRVERMRYMICDKCGRVPDGPTLEVSFVTGGR